MTTDSRLELLIRQDPDNVEPRIVELVDTPSVIFGRSASNQVVIVSWSAGRRHARLTDRDGRLILQDMGSANGTLVRGKRIRDCAINVGGSFEVGSATITIVAHHPVIDRDFEQAESAFLSPIQREPDDEGMREVYSDFLETKNQTLRAEWLRTELACRKALAQIEKESEGGKSEDNDTERIEQIRSKLRTLSQRLFAARRWRMLVARPRIEGCARTSCSTKWGLLPFGTGEMEFPYYERECDVCMQSVLYRDTYPGAFEQSVGRERIIAIDHLVAVVDQG